jgi:L-lactate utilization protein LutB
MNTRRSIGKHAVLVVVLLVAPLGGSLASDFDGSEKLRCVPTDATECSGAGECERVTVEEINIPKWITVDFKKKKLSGTDSDGEEETTTIENVRVNEGQTILQGAEGVRAWSMVIDQLTGDLTAAIAGDETGFVLFGVCQKH